MNWVSLHGHSEFSLLDSSAKPIKNVERAVQLGMDAMALTDHGSISGAVNFMRACQNVCSCGHMKDSHSDSQCYGNKKKCSCTKFNKKEIKPILGCEFYISQDHSSVKTPENRSLAHLVVLAKNLQGWKQLIKAVSASNTKESFYYKPRLSLDQLSEYTHGRDLISFSGHMGSDLANALFENYREAYGQDSIEGARALSNMTQVKKAINLAEKYREIFGRDNFFLEVQRFDIENSPCSEFISNGIRYISRKTGIPCVATADHHYASPEDFLDQRITLCSSMHTTMSAVAQKIKNEEEVGLGSFFKSRNYYIPSPQQIEVLHTSEEVENSVRIADMCEKYDILSKPMLPVFPCPDGLSPDKYLDKLCAVGWNRKVKGHIPEKDIKVYKERIKHELEVIKGAGLESYFLIVQDYVNAARKRGERITPGRGSAAGSFLSFLLNITTVDPIPYKLLFERFYNAGRNTADRVSLPDIDTDFEKYKRKDTIRYIRNMYSDERVGQMITFARLQGRAALKEVFRITQPQIPFDLVNNITKHVPDAAQISDELEEMRQNGVEPNIILWALEDDKKDLREYCHLDKDGEVQGEFGPIFQQAMRIEGLKKAQSRHPSGIVIAPSKLSEIVPMVYDKSNKEGLPVCGFEMNDLESVGLMKADILSSATNDVLHGIQNLLATGEIN